MKNKNNPIYITLGIVAVLLIGALVYFQSSGQLFQGALVRTLKTSPTTTELTNKTIPDMTTIGGTIIQGPLQLSSTNIFPASTPTVFNSQIISNTSLAGKYKVELQFEISGSSKQNKLYITVHHGDIPVAGSNWNFQNLDNGRYVLTWDGKLDNGQMAQEGSYRFMISLQETSTNKYYGAPELLNFNLVKSSADAFTSLKDTTSTVTATNTTSYTQSGTNDLATLTARIDALEAKLKKVATAACFNDTFRNMYQQTNVASCADFLMSN